MLIGLFAFSLGLVAFVYFGYPLVIGALAKLSGRSHLTGDALPTVTIVVAAYQEASVIRAKLENFHAIDYPEDHLSMVVVSDGSTDGTDEIVGEFASDRLCLIRQEPRGGKAAALGLALDIVDSEVVVFTDANVLFDPSAVRRLVRHFEDPAVGVVTGTVNLVDAKVGYAESEGAYFRYERFLQASESRWWSVVGVDGALYAARRALVSAPPPDAILDDFVISMSVATAGYRIIYEPTATAIEDGAPGLHDEFRRKTRTSAGAFQCVRNRWAIPGPRTPALLFCYCAHKLLRWLTPWLLLVILTTNAALLPAGGIWPALLGAHLLFYLVAVVGLAVPPARRLAVVSIPMYFCLMNASVAYGSIRALKGGTSVHWTPTPRTDIDAPASTRR